MAAAAAALGARVHTKGESLPQGCSHVVIREGATRLPLRAYFAAAAGCWTVTAAWACPLP